MKALEAALAGYPEQVERMRAATADPEGADAVRLLDVSVEIEPDLGELLRQAAELERRAQTDLEVAEIKPLLMEIGATLLRCGVSSDDTGARLARAFCATLRMVLARKGVVLC